MADRPSISAASSRALNRLLEAAKDHAFKGAADPEDYDAIEDEYQAAIDAMYRRLSKLESARPIINRRFNKDA